MKARTTTLILTPMLSLRLFSQDLQITAVYYDSDNKPYKIEEKYVDKDSSLLYVGHYKSGSNCISIKNIKHGDTTIISEEYSLFAEEQTPLEKYIQKVSGISYSDPDENNPGTSVSNNGYDSAAVVDSIMPLAEVKKYIESTDFWGANDQLHLRLLIDGKIKPDLSKRILQETVYTFYVNNRLMEIAWTDKDTLLYGLYACTTKDTTMTCTGFGFNKPISAQVSTQTLSWNKDSTIISWLQQDTLPGKYYYNRDCFEGKKLKSYCRGKLVSEIDYLELNDAFKLFIRDGLANDAFCCSQLLGFENFKYKKINKDGHIRAYTYTFDAANRIIEQNQFYDGNPDMRVTYSYDLTTH